MEYNKIVGKVQELRHSFYSRYGIEPNQVILSMDYMYDLTHTIMPTYQTSGPVQHKIFGMSIDITDRENHISVGRMESDSQKKHSL
jgi:hypothetical protein